jgi:tRNA threonylcarbamoyladenosine biosynthesis protein TsaB
VRILALDTATQSCSAALLIDGSMISRERPLEHGHAAQILPMIDALLAEGGVVLSALSAIAFGRGPGAFTGVRLAASVTQGLAFGAGVPVVPISDLAALAQRALEVGERCRRVLACMDARMHEVYWACFERREALAEAVGEERLSAPASVALPTEWAAEGVPRSEPFGAPPDAGRPSQAAHGSGVCGAGSGFAAYPELREGVGARLLAIREELLPRAAEIVRLAEPEVAAGRVFPPEEALPVYLRDEVATRPQR